MRRSASDEAPIPRLVFQNGRYYWKPQGRLRPHWQSVALGTERAAARREARRLNALADAWLADPKNRSRPATVRPPRGPVTVGELIALYRASTDFAQQRPRSRVSTGYELVRLEDEFGHENAHTLTAVRVDDWWDRIRTDAPGTGRHVAARGRAVFNWSIRKGHITANPFQKMKIGQGGRRKARFSWRDVQHVVAAADKAGRPALGTALVIAFCCLQRITDVLELRREDIVRTPAGLRLRFRQSKGEKTDARGRLIRDGYEVDMPLPAAVAARLGTLPYDPDAPLIPWQGRPQRGANRTPTWNEKTAARTFRRLIEKIVKADRETWGHLAGLHLGDGRRSGFVHLVEQGCCVEIATSWSGHSIEEGYAIVEHYLPRTAKMADAVAQYMNVSL